MGPKAKNTATSRKLFSVDRKLVGSAEYLSLRPVPDDPKDLAGWDWLALTPAQNVPLVFSKAGGNRENIKPDALIFANDAQALYRLARAGAGLAIVPDFLAQADLASGLMQNVLPQWQLNAIEVFAVWPANAPKHGLIHLLLDALSKSRN